jgi:PDZ domain-containing secreted protein
MKKFKKVLRRLSMVLLIIMASLLPVPVFIQKKDGKFNDDHSIELVDVKEDENETKLTTKFKS